MPAFAPIAINDGAATPVAHTFSPTSLKENLARYQDKSGGISIGFPEVSVNLTVPAAATNGQSSNDQRNYRARVAVALPILEVTSPSTGTGIQPAPTVAYILRFNGEFILPERADLQGRKHILAYAKNTLAHALVTALVQDLEAVY